MNKRLISTWVVAVLFVLAPWAARAQDEADGAEEGVTEAAPKAAAPKKAAAAAEPSGDVSDVAGYKFPRGIYTQSDLGVFWRYLGFADNGGDKLCFRCRYPTYYVSNGQPFIGFSMGYDVLPKIFDFIPNLKVPEIAKRFGISTQLSVGTGYVANAAPYSVARSYAERPTGAGNAAVKPEDSPKDHAILMVHPAVAFNFNLLFPSVPSSMTNADVVNIWSRVASTVERTVLEARFFVGGATFAPSAQRYEKAFQDPKWWLSTFGANGGMGLSIKYMTLLTNFVVGSDLAIYNMFSPGWGAELFLPPYQADPYGKKDAGAVFPNIVATGQDASGNTNTSVLLPFVVGSSFSPIIIKYVF